MLQKEKFSPTRWSLIAAMRSDSSAVAQSAMETLCQSYWFPIYAYVRRRGFPPEDAADLTQEFFAHLLEKKLLSRAKQERGRLRSLLLTALQRFLTNWKRDQQRQKRGGSVPHLSIDEAHAEGLYARELADNSTPEVLYDRQWALALLQRTLLGLRSGYEKLGRARRFDILKPALTDELDTTAAAEQLGISQPAVRSAVVRLRTRYRSALLAEVAASLDARTEAEVNEEIAALFRML
jgi:RNA polymerase sigma factor (sigma-70 family)